MEFVFYICGCIAILSAFRVVTNINPMHMQLYLITLLLAISGIFFALGAQFVGALEIIIYAGAIMVLFIFIIMILNLNHLESVQEHQSLQLKVKFVPIILSIVMLMTFFYVIAESDKKNIDRIIINMKGIGVALFGPYLLAVELISILLLAGLIIVSHIGNDKEYLK